MQPGGAFTVSASGKCSFTVMLEASRAGPDKDGRRYTIAVTAQDRAGNSATATVVVLVPLSRGK